MDRLIEGYRRFRASGWPERRAVFERLAEGGQRPRALVIACSDSRVDPTMIFDAGPGELFVVRNVANLVPPYAPDARHHSTSAAIEFAVKGLKVQHVVVMGHALCGGVDALLNGVPEGLSDFVGTWIAIAAPARERAAACRDPAARQEACERETVKVSLDNLRSFPWVSTAIAEGRLALHGCRFDIRTGILERLAEDGAFQAVT